jgi:hypothetical protein
LDDLTKAPEGRHTGSIAIGTIPPPSSVQGFCMSAGFAIKSPAMQLKQAIDGAYHLFTENNVPSPRLNAELLMMFVLGRERAYLFAHPERELSAEEQTQYE